MLCPPRLTDMEMLRRSSVFAAEVFDRSPSDKELVSQAKALCRDYINNRLNRAGLGAPKLDYGPPASSGGTLTEVSSVLLWLGRFAPAPTKKLGFNGFYSKLCLFIDLFLTNKRRTLSMLLNILYLLL